MKGRIHETSQENLVLVLAIVLSLSILPLLLYWLKIAQRIQQKRLMMS